MLVPLVGTGLVGWWLIGDVSEPGGEGAILSLPSAERHAGWFGIAGLAITAAWAADRWRHWRRFQPRTPALLLSASGAAAGVLAAAGMRVVTARVHGANIGGGMVILASPVALVVLAVVTIVLGRRVARPSRPESRVRRPGRGRSRAS